MKQINYEKAQLSKRKHFTIKASYSSKILLNYRFYLHSSMFCVSCGLYTQFQNLQKVFISTNKTNTVRFKIDLLQNMRVFKRIQRPINMGLLHLNKNSVFQLYELLYNWPINLKIKKKELLKNSAHWGISTGFEYKFNLFNGYH